MCVHVRACACITRLTSHGLVFHHRGHIGAGADEELDQGQVRLAGGDGQRRRRVRRSCVHFHSWPPEQHADHLGVSATARKFEWRLSLCGFRVSLSF